MTDTAFDEEAIFKVVFQIPSENGRMAYLNQVCGDCPQAVERILALLRVHDDAPAFLSPPASILGATAVGSISEQPGDTIGPYKLREQIGEGGFGVVYVAEQQEPIARKVALKIIKPGMDTKLVIARFEAERQALAMMDHPNIAKVFDAGMTDTGRPYFVMELVHGVPITEFCDQQKYSNPERLKIFVDVCRAVKHAHQKGIIHRDLKPSNIMVTLDDDRPIPKVIDFGVSKALSGNLTDQTVYTEYGQMVGTPLYMAPEQAAMTLLDVDTRSDIYSLGVLLYELLTGTTPFDRETLKTVGIEELRRILREDDPPCPSVRISTLNAELMTTACDHRRIDSRNLTNILRGELDWIVMKALEKDRNRRYESASAFAADIHRHLNDETVLACPPSRSYRLRKFVKRNSKVVAAAVFACLSLLIIAFVSVIAAKSFRTLADEKQAALTAETEAKSIARNAQREAERSRDQANSALYNSLVSQATASRTSGRPGQCVKSLQALKEAAALMPRLGLGPEDARKLRNEAIAAMGLIDLKEDKQFPLPRKDWFATFDPQRNRYACADSSNCLAIWNLSDHRKISQLPISQRVDQQWPRTFTRDGRFLFGMESTGTVYAWDVDCDDFVLRVNEKTRNVQAQVSAEGGRLALIAGDGSVSLFNLTTGKKIGSLPTKALTLSLSPGGSQVAVVIESSQAVEIWDCEKGSRLHSLPISGAYLTAWSPDAKLLACGLEKEQKIVVWNLKNNELCTELIGHHNAGINFCFNHDGSILSSASWDSTARLWDPFTGHELIRTRGKRCELHGPGDTLALRYGKSAYLWRLIHSEECQSLQTADSRYGNLFTGVDFWWGGPVVAYSRRDGLRVCNLQSKERIAFAPLGMTDSILFHEATNSLISSGSAGIHQWPIRVSDDGTRWRIGPPRRLFDREFAQTGASPLAQSRDGSHLAAVVDYLTVKVFSLTDAFQPVTLRGHKDVYNVTISPDGRWVVTATNFGRGIKVWNAATGRPVSDLWPEASSGHAAFSPDGNMIAVCTVEELRIFDTKTWKPVRSVSWELIGNRLDWSPDSRLIVIAAEDKARLIDPQTGEEVATVTSPNNAGNIQSFSFSPDGGRLAIVYRDAVEVWDIRRVRNRLAAMGLDWDLPAIPTEEKPQALPDEIEFDLGTFGKEDEYYRLLDRTSDGFNITKRDAEKVDQALETLSTAIENDPGHIEWRILKGQLNWNLGRDDEAINDFSEALVLEPENASALYRRGRAYLWSDDLPRAIQDFETALRLDPKNPKLISGVPMWYSWIKPSRPNAERGLVLAAQALALNEDDTRSLYAKGSALYRLGRLDEAEQAIHQAMRIGVRWLRPHLSLAAIYHRRGEAARAHEAFRIAQTSERSGLALTSVYVMQNARWEREARELLGIEDSQTGKSGDETLVFEGEQLLLAAQVTEGRTRLRVAKEVEGGSTLHWCPSHEGARATFALPIPEAGSYRVSAKFAKSPMNGIARVSAAGESFAETFDGYDDKTNSSGPIEFGRAEFAAGENQITIEVVGSNPKSDGYQVHIEELKLTKE